MTKFYLTRDDVEEQKRINEVVRGNESNPNPVNKRQRRIRSTDKDAYAVWCIATLDSAISSGGSSLATVVDFGGPKKHAKDPSNDDGKVTFEDNNFGQSYSSGEKLLGLLRDETQTDNRIYEIVKDENDGTGGGGDTVDSLLVDKESGSQSAGDPVTPITVLGIQTRYFSGTLSTTGDIWILLNNHRDDLSSDDIWLPALATFNGLLSGTYDPNAIDPTNYPESDERPVYRVDGLPHGLIPGYCTTAFTAASGQGGASPTFTTGSFQTYIEGPTGTFGDGPLLTGVRYNLESAVEAGTVGFVGRSRGKFFLLPSCSVGSSYSG